jgi:thioredoxin 1
MTDIINATDNNFNEVIKSSKYVLVDFWAEWCGPCRNVLPMVEEIAKNNDNDDLSVVKVNIDDNPLTPSEYKVRTIPTLIIFKDGEVAQTKIGASSVADLQKFIDDNK